MPDPGCAYFVADAHLGQGPSDQSRARERDLLDLFGRVRQERAALYVNGDLFDFWFEYGHAIPKPVASAAAGYSSIATRL